ncbi:predicted protein [Nematostella vectensis]|uniref:DUF985 domain-containing protein n=1 Tax=Nematostella vectensis TaxID=45351 RepID=A7SQ90_NEMVE|nr:uncharacterized protein LOC5505387 [Nematostella vectensis]EDO34140.1 predicted protein [Nematostella vectensis]|eukprot:XP_001626240.1 predicted protein [Nematostella vectensis]
MARNKGEELIKKLNLEPHPYGGYYRPLHRSVECVAPADGRGPRSATTSIYLVMQHGDIDPWHRMKSEETFFYHKGCSLRLYILTDDGKLDSRVVGDGMSYEDASFAVVIPANTWFAGELAHEDADSYGFFSVSVSPGFDFSDSEIGKSDMLCELYPIHSEILKRLELKPQPESQDKDESAE